MSQGKNEIIKKIKKDAERISLSTLDEANAKAKEIIALAYNDAKIFKENYMSKSYAKRDEIMHRKATVAVLEVKKIILKKKQDILENVYAQAVEKIKSDKKAYLKLINAMLKNASKKDTIVISKSDANVITKKVIQDFNKENGYALTLSDTYGDFIGGIMIEGKISDIDLSLDVEMDLIREATEQEVAKMIFGVNNG